MFEQDIFRINAGIADGLEGIKSLKNLVVRSQKYEYAAKLRDIEKHLESVAEELRFCPYPALNKGLTPKGKLFYNQLFNYCTARDWKQIPANFIELLQERKEQLNRQMKFDDDTSGKLISLNVQLTATEDHLHEFIDFIRNASFLPGIKKASTDEQDGSLIIKCYTQTNYYEFLRGSFDHRTPFYQLRLSPNALVNSLTVFYDNDLPPPDILQTLPIKFRDEKICLLFSVLAQDGFLAWEDFLNIDRIAVEIAVRHRFSTSN